MGDSVVPSCVSVTSGAADTASKFHHLKRSAYASVLRSFCAQSDILSGAKEECLAQLRKELKILDTEHREYLVEARSNKQMMLLSAGMIKASTCNNDVMKDNQDLGSTVKDGDTGFQIHCLERSAYASVLRALGAITNHLSWLQVKLLAKLRNELRVSHIEHKEVLAKVISDEHIKSLRKFSLENYSVIMKMDAAFHAQAVVPDKITSMEQLSTSSTSCLSLVQKCPIPEQSIPSIRDNGILDNSCGAKEGSIFEPHVAKRQESRKRKTKVLVMSGSKNRCVIDRRTEMNKDLNLEHSYELFKIRLTTNFLNKAHENDLLDALAKLSEVPNDEGNGGPAEVVINHDEIPPRSVSSTDKMSPETSTSSPSADSTVTSRCPHRWRRSRPPPCRRSPPSPC